LGRERLGGGRNKKARFHVPPGHASMPLFPGSCVWYGGTLRKSSSFAPLRRRANAHWSGGVGFRAPVITPRDWDLGAGLDPNTGHLLISQLKLQACLASDLDDTDQSMPERCNNAIVPWLFPAVVRGFGHILMEQAWSLLCRRG
jgi:hypothetical protein